MPHIIPPQILLLLNELIYFFTVKCSQSFLIHSTTIILVSIYNFTVRWLIKPIKQLTDCLADLPTDIESDHIQ